MSWHVHKCDLIGSTESEFEQNEFKQDVDYDLIQPGARFTNMGYTEKSMNL